MIRFIRFQQWIAYLQVFSFWLLIASLPFRICPLQRIIMASAGVCFLLDYAVNMRWTDWKWNTNKWFYVILIAYYLLIPIWHIADDVTTPRFRFVLEERIPFVLCGIIGLLGLNREVKLKPIVYVMLVSCFAVSLYAILRSTGFSYFLLPLSEQSHVFCHARIDYIASHMLFNIYLNVTLVFVFWLVSRQKLKRYEKILTALLSLWIFYLLCITEGRVGLGTCLLLVAMIVAIVSFRYGWKVFLPVLTVYVCFAALVLMNNNRVTPERLEHDPRWLIWNADLRIISDHPLIGNGVCDAKEALIREAKEDAGLSKFYTQRLEAVYNGNYQKVQPHNAFLEAWMEFGLTGLALLILIFLYPLQMFPRRSRLYCMLIVLCFVIQSCFDSFFAPLLYCLSILLLTSRSAISEQIGSEKRIE